MLHVQTDDIEVFDEAKNTFIHIPPQTMDLEHSLISLSKYEAMTHDPLLTADEVWPLEKLKTYISCMTVRPPQDERIFAFLPNSELMRIQEYINDPHTATKISKLPGEAGGSNTGRKPSRNNGTYMSSELLYYYIFSLQIPIDVEKWHLNRLITLIRIFEEKQKPQKKKSREQIQAENAALNAKRLAASKRHK